MPKIVKYGPGIEGRGVEGRRFLTQERDFLGGGRSGVFYRQCAGKGGTRALGQGTLDENPGSRTYSLYVLGKFLASLSPCFLIS